METKEQRRQRELKTCKHFTGIQNPHCRNGVNYETVKDTESNPYRWACLSDGQDLPCELREYPTEEELESQDKEIGRMIKDMFKARKAITDRTGGARNVAGRITCPVCEYGSLTYGVAYNGHIRAKCSTDDCVNWIE